jgi:hypothetical protein
MTMTTCVRGLPCPPLNAIIAALGTDQLSRSRASTQARSAASATPLRSVRTSSDHDDLTGPGRFVDPGALAPGWIDHRVAFVW